MAYVLGMSTLLTVLIAVLGVGVLTSAFCNLHPNNARRMRFWRTWYPGVFIPAMLGACWLLYLML